MDELQTQRMEARSGGLSTSIDLQRIRLEVVEGPDQGRSVVSDDEMLLQVGTRENNHLLLNDKSVSGYHLEIARTSAGWRLRDVGSTGVPRGFF